MRHRAALLPFALSAVASGAVAQDPPLREANPRDDFTVREEMVPMRDGVKLYTRHPRAEAGRRPLPILLERTPYDASSSSRRHDPPRGRHRAGHRIRGWRLHLRGPGSPRTLPLGGRLRDVPRAARRVQPTATDETTDAWDTIDWLVKNVPEQRARSACGARRTPAGSRSRPCAIRIPRSPPPCRSIPSSTSGRPTTGSTGARSAPPTRSISSTRWRSRKGASVGYPYEARDLYTWMLRQGAAGRPRRTPRRPARDVEAARGERRATGRTGATARPIAGSIAPDAARCPPCTCTASGTRRTSTARRRSTPRSRRHDPANDRNFFAAGPWYHGQHFADGSRLGALSFDEDTAKRFREDVLAPFLRRFLKGERRACAGRRSPSSRPGRTAGGSFDRWPPACRDAAALPAAGRTARRSTGRRPPRAAFTEYVSDPAKPVPNAPRPHWGFDYDNPARRSPPGGGGWSRTSASSTAGPTCATWASEPLDGAADDPRPGHGAARSPRRPGPTPTGW